jgi:hypothetical protein
MPPEHLSRKKGPTQEELEMMNEQLQTEKTKK